MAFGTLLLACGLGACIRAPALVVGARSTLGSGDHGPLGVVMLCGLDWSRATGSARRALATDSIGLEGEVPIELDESGSAPADCAIASLCEWETHARQAVLSRTLAALPEVAP
jgi:hypothetical protein